jgi:hypothetical protein
LAGGLYQNKTLEDLCLNFSSIGNDGCRAIASSLAACGLKHLDQVIVALETTVQLRLRMESARANPWKRW